MHSNVDTATLAEKMSSESFYPPFFLFLSFSDRLDSHSLHFELWI